MIFSARRAPLSASFGVAAMVASSAEAVVILNAPGRRVAQPKAATRTHELQQETEKSVERE